MRIFGRVTNFLQISRCVSYHAPLFRPRSLLYTERLGQLCCSASSGSKSSRRTTQPSRVRVQRYSQKGSNVFSVSDNADVLRKRISFSGTSGKAPKIMPIGLITPETADGKDLKIVIVPLDISAMDANELKDTLETINKLRLYANHIETFSNSMVEEYGALNEAVQEVESADQPQGGAGERHSWESYPAHVNAVGTALDAGQGVSLPMQRQAAVNSCLQNALNSSAASSALKTTKSMSAMAQMEPILGSTNQESDFVEEVRVDVPQDLSNRLNDMAVSSMELSFEMDMTNLRQALESKGTNAVTPQDPMICMHTKVELDAPGTVEQTLPLRFNALISGVVEIDTKKLSPAQLTEDKMPAFNDDLTSLAANLCSTALEKGFAGNSKSSDTYIADLELTKDEETIPTRIIDTSYMSAANQVGHVREAQQKIAEEACAMPGTQEQEVPVPVDKDGCKHPPVKPKRKCPGKCPLITDPCKDDPCERPKKKKTPKKALKTTEITCKAKSSCGKDKKKDPCGKKDSKKKDPCAKFKSGEKKDPCAKKKDDPCAKKKDPCAKKKEDPCAKKKDPCAKKKKDPCAKKKKDPCAKKKKDPCAKKKKDPCAKKKKDPCAKKDKKKDPCAKGKKDDKKKKDPCAKFKKGGAGGGKGKCKFSTLANHPDASRRYLSTALSQVFREPNTVSRGPRFQVYSTLVRRHYRVPVPKIASSCTCSLCKSRLLHKAVAPARFTINTALLRRRFGGLTGRISGGALLQSSCRGYAEEGKSGGKCGEMKPKYPINRGKDIKERTGLREDCFDNHGDCPKKSCTGKCAKVKFPKKKCDRKKKKDE